jgi:hypothetical protein
MRCSAISKAAIKAAIVALAVTLAATASLRAQETNGYASAVFTISPWSVQTIGGASPSTRFVNTTGDSVAVGIAAEFGWHFRRRDSVAVEAYVPSRSDLTQVHDYFDPYMLESRYRDFTVLGIVRHRLLPDFRTHIELVGGLGINSGSSLQRAAKGQFGSGTYAPFVAEDDRRQTSLAATAGVDVPIDVARHLSVVPQFRVLILPRGDMLELPLRDVLDREPAFASFGLDNIVYRYGLGLRVGF